MANHKFLISRDTLVEFYWNQFLSPGRIAAILQCSSGTVKARMRELGVPLRAGSEARFRYKKFDFSGNLIEKAYLIGFRLGDLNVYQRSTKSSLIIARCNTTQGVQIDLIKKLFSKYGKVTISPGVYSTNVNCYLNMTFNFLLPKSIEVPKWIENDVYAAAFIAGYVDAEGNFILNQNRARFKLDSYDLGILTWITKWLNKKHILVKFRCIARKGDPRGNNVQFNWDLWRININEAISLLKFIEYIKPFIKHTTRLKDSVTCEQNIQERIKNKTVKYAN